MQKAEQEVLLQTTNQDVLNIRQQELNYFTTFFNSFSLQAALLAGFVLNSLNDNEYDKFAGHQVADYVYWISSAVLFASALHCILTTVYCNVYGAGLALRGPLGSMVRAVDGMVAEKDGIVLSFIICLTSFATSCLGYFWVIMTDEAAWISTAVMMVAMYFWCSHGLRVYNKFKWDETGTAWLETVDGDDETQPLLRYAKQSQSELYIDPSSTPQVFKEGYLSIKITVSVLESWVRKYFVLIDGTLYQFETQLAYERRPNQPTMRKPIHLGSYKLDVGKSTRTESRFLFSLLSVDGKDEKKVWTFKCDTTDELNDWTTKIADSITLAEADPRQSSSSQPQHQGDNSHRGDDFIDIR